MKLCMSQYSYESTPDAKFESGNFSSFGENGFNFEKMSFYVQIRSFRLKIPPPPPPCQFQQF